jgi:hypothetical protein
MGRGSRREGSAMKQVRKLPHTPGHPAEQTAHTMFSNVESIPKFKTS